MNVWAYRFTAKQLRSIHPDHVGFILASSHCCNELTSVAPYLIFEQDTDEVNEVEQALILIRFFTLVRLQIGKIFEYRDLCNEYVAKIRRTFPATAERIGERSKLISRRIRAAGWAETVRNKVAFHFDSSYAAEALNNLTPDHELKFIVGQTRGVTAFDFADRILTAAMFIEAGKGDYEAGRDAVQKWTIELQSEIAAFHARTIQEIFQQYGLMKEAEELELRDQYCSSPGKAFIPIAALGNWPSSTE